jgi:hypothetical protein
MACPNGKAWCPGPGGFGNKCQACQPTGSSTKGTGLPSPTIPPSKSVPLPTPTIVPIPPVKLKTVIPLPVPDIVATTVTSSGGRSVVLYRGDSREPGEIKRVGFERWGESIANVSKAGGLANYIGEKCKELKNGKTFADFVRVSKNQGRPTISTSLNQGCGGYDSGPIYKIQMSGLQEFDLDQRIMPASFADIDWRSDGLKAYMTGPTLLASQGAAHAIVIDLRLGTEEWAFFTNVPSAKITDYKEGKGAFTSMSTVAVKVKKLW